MTVEKSNWRREPSTRSTERSGTRAARRCLRGPRPVERVSPSQSSRTATAQSQTLLRARSDRPQLARRPLLPDRLIPSPNLDPIPRLGQTARTRRGSLFSDVLPCLPPGRAPLAPARPRRSVPFDGSFRDRRQRFRRTLPALSQHSPSAGPFPNEIGRVTSAIADERVPTARHPRASLRPTAVGMTRQLGHPPSARDTAPHRMSRAVFFGLRIRTTPRRPTRLGLRARLPAPQRGLPRARARGAGRPRAWPRLRFRFRRDGSTTMLVSTYPSRFTARAGGRVSAKSITHANRARA